MIHIFRWTIILCLNFIVATFFFSCKEDPNDPDLELSGDVAQYFPSYSVTLLLNYSTSNNNISLTCTPNFNFDPSEWGVKVDKIDYFVDNSFAETVSQSPFVLHYQSENWTRGTHTVRADVTISGAKINTFTLECSKTFNTQGGSSGGDNPSASFKSADIWFDWNYATTGEEFLISANINYDRSPDGTTAKSFSAKWDDVSFGEKSYPPFEAKRIISDSPGTSHKVEAVMKYSIGTTELSHSFSFPSYEIPGPESVRYTYILKTSIPEYTNGQYIKGIARCFTGSEVKDKYGVELYLDDVLIGESKSFPYEQSYLLSGWEKGDHTLLKRWICYDVKGNQIYAINSTETITITE